MVNDANNTTNISPIYKFSGSTAATVTVVSVPLADFLTDADPDDDLAFIHDVLAAAQEIFLNPPTPYALPANPSQAQVDTLRIHIRDLVYTQLTRNELAPTPFIAAAPEESSDSTDSVSEPETGQEEVDLADLQVQQLKYTCVQCRNFYYTTNSPYYMNYTWYVNCLNGPCT